MLIISYQPQENKSEKKIKAYFKARYKSFWAAQYSGHILTEHKIRA